MYCLKCGSNILERHVRFVGACVCLDYTCSMGHQDTWYSSPSSNQTFFINVKVACVTTMSGIRYSAIKHFCDLIELPFISRPRFDYHRTTWLFPVITKMFITGKDKLLSQLKNKASVALCGDGQFDSPGFSAKFCTYSLMDCETNEIIDFCVIQKGQHSGELETQSCRQVMQVLVDENGIKVDDFVTDRHAGIGKMMRELFPVIFHWFDVWHMVKSLSSKLRTAKIPANFYYNSLL